MAKLGLSLLYICQINAMRLLRLLDYTYFRALVDTRDRNDRDFDEVDPLECNGS